MDTAVKPMTRADSNVLKIGVQTSGVLWTPTLAISKPVQCRILQGLTTISLMRRATPISKEIHGLAVA